MKSVPLAPVRPPAQSPPSRGAWIEMGAICWKDAINIVAPLAGGVD